MRTDTSVARGPSRPGRERHLADKAFTVVTRTLCEIDDGTTADGVPVDTGTAPATVVTLETWGAEATSRDDAAGIGPTAVGGLASPVAGPSPSTTPSRLPMRVASSPGGSAAPRMPGRVEPVLPLGRAPRTPHLPQRRRHGRAVVLGLMVAVAVIAFVMKFMHAPQRGAAAANEAGQKKHAPARGR